jgi:hypothetical protein
MKAIILMIENVDLDSSCGQVETSTKVNIRKTNVTVTEKCIGPTEVAIKVNGFEEYSMVTDA